jgi:hypothetical protein
MKKCIVCKKLEKENKKLQRTIDILRKVIFTHVRSKYPVCFNNTD